MSTRALSGMEYLGFEIRLDIAHEPKALTKALKSILEGHPSHWLQTVSVGCDPCSETDILYTVILAGA